MLAITQSNVGKIYRDILLRQQMLPAISTTSSRLFTFQQHGAAAHYSRETVQLLREHKTPDFMGLRSGHAALLA